MENKKLILLIDDSPDFTEIMKLFLEASNFRVITASRGVEGLEKALLKPDLILLDLNMPLMNGHETCKHLKEKEETKAIPVVMLTSQDATLDKVEALEIGVVDYIGKHFPLEEILARIKAIIRQASPETSSQASEERNKRIMELRKIIDEKLIRPFYQPIVDLKTKEPIGFESLSRGPKGNILESPIDLFNVASDSNMFFALDSLCRSLGAKKADFLTKDQLLFMNTDPLVIDTEGFEKLEFLKDSLVTPRQLCFEITERTCIKNFSSLKTGLEYFKSQGIQIAIDDVGEGYSSLKAIAELKPKFLKIDISLVRNIDTDDIKQSLVSVIRDIAIKLNSHIIAEGIETPQEHETLLKLGIEYGQGYLFARPFEKS